MRLLIDILTSSLFLFRLHPESPRGGGAGLSRNPDPTLTGFFTGSFLMESVPDSILNPKNQIVIFRLLIEKTLLGFTSILNY